MGSKHRTKAIGFALASMMAITGITSAPVYAAETIVFSGWGGNWQAAEKKHYFETFEKETGIKVIDVPDVNLSKIKAMVGAGNVEWDVVQAIGMWVAEKPATDQLFEALDYSRINTDGVRFLTEFDPNGGNASYHFEWGLKGEGLNKSTPESDTFGFESLLGIFSGENTYVPGVKKVVDKLCWV